MAQVQLEPSHQTREKILTTASRLFFDQGYEGTALSQVAREAHVSKALIFWHFDSKEKLFRTALGRTLEPYFIDVNDLEGLDEAAQLERLIDLFYEFVRDNAYSIRLFLRLMLHRERQPNDVLARISELHELFRRVLVDVLQRGQRGGRFRANLDPLAEASLILATLQGILVECCLGGALPDEPSPLLGHLKRATLTRLIAAGLEHIDDMAAGLSRHPRGAPGMAPRAGSHRPPPHRTEGGPTTPQPPPTFVPPKRIAAQPAITSSRWSRRSSSICNSCHCES